MLEWATNKFKYSVGNIIWINCLIEFFLVLTVGLMAYAITCNPFSITEFYRWTAITICFIAQVFFARSGITKKNIFDMKLFCALAVLTALLIYAKFGIYFETCSMPPGMFALIIIACVLIIVNLFFFFAAYAIVKDKFLTELVMRNAATEEEQMKFNLWSEIKALVSLNTIFQVLVLVGYFTFYDYEKSKDEQDDTFYVIDSLVLFTFFIFSRVGYVALISVNKVDNLNIYLVFGVVLNIYESVRCVMLIDYAFEVNTYLMQYEYSVSISQGVATVIGIVIQVLLIIRCIPFVKYGNDYLRGYYNDKERSSSSWGSKTQKTYSDMFESQRSHNAF